MKVHILNRLTDRFYRRGIIIRRMFKKTDCSTKLNAIPLYRYSKYEMISDYFKMTKEPWVQCLPGFLKMLEDLN